MNDRKRTSSGPEEILRSYAEQIPTVLSVHNMKRHLIEAADEIERLRRQVGRWERLAKKYRQLAGFGDAT